MQFKNNKNCSIGIFKINSRNTLHVGAIIAVALNQYVTLVTSFDLGVARCFHQIGADRRGKEISSNRPSLFVLVRSYYLTLALLSRKTSFLLFLSSFYPPPFFLSLSNASPLPRFRSFIYPFFPAHGAIVTILSQSPSLSRVQQFPKTISLLPGRGNRPNADAAGELSRLRSPSAIATHG